VATKDLSHKGGFFGSVQGLGQHSIKTIPGTLTSE